MHKINLKCGPSFDEREITLEFPSIVKSIGIFHSGGMDSTILLHLVTKYFPEYQPIVFTVNKTVGDNEVNSNRVLEQMGLTQLKRVIIDISPNLHHSRILPVIISDTIVSGMIDFVFTAGNAVPSEGTIQSVFNSPVRIPKNPNPVKICIPFLNVYKYHILDLYYRENVQHLIPFTHSCTELTTGYCDKCWFCGERKWAFEKLNKEPIMGT